MRYASTCAIAVPKSPSATPEPTDFQPGACVGSVSSASGNSSRNAITNDAAASTGAFIDDICLAANRFAPAYEIDASVIAPVPAAPIQPPAGCTPASTATPASPSSTPT